MKSFLIFAVLVALAVADPVYQNAKDATIIKHSSDNIGTDGYKYYYETSDGKSAYEEAVLKNLGAANEGIEVRGEYSYYGTDGILYTVTYVANENGYQPSAKHLPTASA